MQLRLFSLSLVLASSFAAGGCGLVSDNFDAELKVDFTVDEMGGTFRQEIAVNPADYPDVRENCDAIEKETGQIRSLSIEITDTMENHEALLGSGMVFMRNAGGPEWPAETEENAFATFDRVPLLTGQVITLELTPARRAALADLIFTENCDKALDIKMFGESDRGPVSFKGKVTLFVEFIASAG